MANPGVVNQWTWTGSELLSAYVPTVAVTVKAKSSPGELPLVRPITMGGEEAFRNYIRSSRLNKELKDALCRDGVFIGNPEYVVSLLEKMIADGGERFQVVSDFDATLTRYHREGKRCDTSYGILDTNQRMPSWFREECDKLRKKYYPIELDPLLSVEEKVPHMRTWWTRAHDLLIKVNFELSWLSKMVQESSVELRERTGVLFAIIDHCGIPLLIYSAGIGDIIREVLSQKCTFKAFQQQPLIVANYMRFNNRGLLEGFSEELIHTFNKNEIFPHHRDYFTKHEKRRNVMLMGDMLGDLRMADGMRAKENVITIGFLNSKVQDSFPLYRDSFDIVLMDDQTMDIPIAVVESVIRSAG
ncbi:7-methylguanosine phosphate-specific 5'-nucleotidase-like isoform X2 [Paramacrobiotus metropolitanus]|uniref:7-methylguanosine phosphate-specific 5'-nucleotidase-like isoform X2 n=1 Tax=Paramacrobiotus metropolitanus TaxID=2943436 RepID=UPI002445CF00|nr:7-methylguanosine phosphate-specific 5'-nucleotidase-like isoform X2 [Paramacrobiotus metropolitanus]